MESTELMHYGVKGMKWGVRRKRNYFGTGGVKGGPYRQEGTPAGAKGGPRKQEPAGVVKGGPNTVNKDYTAKQRKHDRAFYGKGGEKRINKRLNEGHGLRGARHYEAERKEKNEKLKRVAKKGAKKVANVMSTIGTYYMIDQVFYNGAGTRIAKETAVQTGRAAITAIKMAMGDYDIKWYDKQGRRVG